MEFNDKQIQAINKLDGRVRIVAGAGSGKTRVLTERYVKLLEKVYPSQILCVTFTNKAANEMKQRIESKVGELKNSYICTFHSYCLRVLRESISKLGYPSNFIIADSQDQLTILKKVYKECDIDAQDIKYSLAEDIVATRKIQTEDHILSLLSKDNTIMDLYNKAKNKLWANKYASATVKKPLVEDCIYYGYLLSQQKVSALDFNDLIIVTVALFKEHPEVLQKWQSRIKYIMVDEFQDASSRQYELVQMLSETHGNLFVVGDPDQTIYSWRGAKPEILLDFDKGIDTTTIIMNQNYRSTPNILDVANHLISKNTKRIKKDLFTQNAPATPVYYCHLGNADDEAKYIVDMIKYALQKYKPRDIAILYRTHRLSKKIEEQLIRRNVPYKIYSGINFYERMEVKDILSYLRLINNTEDDLALERIINVPKRGIGTKKVDCLREYANENNCSLYTALQYYADVVPQYQDFIFMVNVLKNKLRVQDFNLVDFTWDVLELSGYKQFLNSAFDNERKENIQELFAAMAEYKDITLEEYLQEISLLTNTDKKEEKDCISLMTIHAAKGLEFPIVMVAGMSEEIFPNKKSVNEGSLEEERRLAYVAYTRAKKFLFLTDNEGVDALTKETKYTSRFVTELQREKLKVLSEPNRPFMGV